MSKKEFQKKEEFEDIENEDFVIEDEEFNSPKNDSSQKLREKLKKATKEKQEYLDGWQRARAELINAKKEFAQQKEELLKYSKEDLVLQIIPVLDSFEMALLGIKIEDEKLREWSQGAKHIYNQLLGILEENGVRQINPLGEVFDPTKHNSVESVEVDDEESKNIIVEVVQKGYEMSGKIIREAKVKTGI